MARSHFCSSNLQLCGQALTVTFSNDSVSRSKRPLQDFPEGDQEPHHQVEAKRQQQHWETFCGSPSPSPKMPPPPPSLLSSPGNRAASQASYSLATNRYRDDSDPDASLLEPSDGEEPDSPLGLSPEAEAKLLADDDDDDDDAPAGHVDLFAPFLVFGGKGAEAVASSGVPLAAEATQPPSIPRALEQTLGPEPRPLPGPADLLGDGLAACRKDSGVPACGRPLSRGGSRIAAGLGLRSSSPFFPEAVPTEAASASRENQADGSVVLEEEGATWAGRGVGWLTAASLRGPQGPLEEQGSLVQELGGESAGQPPEESEGELNPANWLGEAATPPLNSASNQSEDHVENIQRPKSPARQQRIHISQADLEGSMRSYISTVLAHMRHCDRIIGPVNELHALMQRVSSESHVQGHSFRHPADLTMRNYAERVNRPTQRCTLGQWVIRHQRDRPLFADIPDRFERSPIPSL